MYEPKLFRVEERAVLMDVVRAFPLGLIIAPGNGNGACFASADLIPMIADAEGDVLRAHVARANPLVAALAAPQEVLVVFQGPQAYVSPSWYPSKREHGRVVPTWNYVMVQAQGVAHLRDESAWLGDQVAALTASLESQREKPWAVEDAPADFLAAQKKAIVGVEIVVSCWSAKYKLSQNRSDADRKGVIAGLATENTQQARSMAQSLAQFMSAREAPDDLG